MDGTMNVAVMEGIGKMGYARRPIPTPKADEVLVELAMAAGLTRFQRHFVAHFEALDIAAYFYHDAAGFVSQDEGELQPGRRRFSFCTKFYPGKCLKRRK